MRKQINTIIIDCNNVLWYSPELTRIYPMMADYLGIPADRRNKFNAQFVKLMESFPHIISNRYVSRKMLLNIFEKRMPVLKDYNISAKKFINAFCEVDDGTILNKQAVNFVSKLRCSGYKLVAKSNWLNTVQEKWLKQYKLMDYFEMSQGLEDSYLQPNPSAFLNIVSCKSTDHFMIIGAGIRKNIAAASILGVESIWFNEFGFPNDSCFTPTFEVSSLSEILDILC